MDHDAIQPFRCIYDPALSRGQSKGPKPLIAKPRSHEKSEDPRTKVRLHENLTKSVRAVPSGILPLPAFAKTLVVTTRCFISGLGPLTTRSRLYDTLCTYGPINDCQVAVSQFTGTSLGIAWAEFSPGAPDAFAGFLHACETDKVLVDSCKLTAKADRTGSLLSKATEEAESELQTKEKIRKAAELSKRKQELAPLELRDLSPARLAEWFDKYLGPNPTYILIRRATLNPTKKAFDTISEIFKGTRYRHVVGNYTGLFIVYDNEDDAINALIKHQDRRLHGAFLAMSLTLSGDRIKQGELKRMYRSGRLSELKNRGSMPSSLHAFANREGDEKANMVSSPQTPFSGLSLSRLERDVITGELDIPAGVLDAASRQALLDAKAAVKRSFFDEKIQPLIKRVVERALKESWEAQQQKLSTEDEMTDSKNGERNGDSAAAAASETAGSSDSESIPQNGIGGFGVARWPNQRSFNPFKPTKRISSIIFGTRIKKIKTSHSRTSGARSYVRAPINNADDLSGFDKKGIKSETPETPETSGTPDTSSEDIKNDVGTILDSSSKNGLASATATVTAKSKPASSGKSKKTKTKEVPTVDDMEVDEEEAVEEEEEIFGMSIPEYPVSEDIESVASDIRTFRQLVRSQNDFESLTVALGNLNVVVEDDNLMKGIFLQKLNANEKLESDAWMPDPGTLEFRLAPVREYSEDERRQYLPNLGRGVPMEIVQSYSENPLYDVREKVSINDEDRDTTKTLNVSRSSFNADSELFSGNNLSKNTKDTRLARSNIHQWGLYADQQIPANEFVIEYVGDMLREEFAEIRERNYGLEGIDSTYLFRLDNGTVVDATKRGNGARFINHSCDPNCVPQVFDFDGMKRVVLFSTRDIEFDEELTFDYNFVRSHDEHFQVRCACGAANCRGWLM